jgi:hypothetical protein
VAYITPDIVRAKKKMAEIFGDEDQSESDRSSLAQTFRPLSLTSRGGKNRGMSNRRVFRHPLASAAALMATRTRKVKTSVSLSEGLLRAVDMLAGKSSRSAWIERSIRASVQRALRRQRDDDEVRLLNKHAESLNRESADALAYQTPWDAE